MPTWLQHKADLKDGHLTIDRALREPELQSRRTIEILCLAALAPPMQRNHYDAADLAESVLEAADLPAAHNVSDLRPVDVQTILTLSVTHPPPP